MIQRDFVVKQIPVWIDEYYGVLESDEVLVPQTIEAASSCNPVGSRRMNKLYAVGNRVRGDVAI